jgi:hypothetical protein
LIPTFIEDLYGLPALNLLMEQHVKKWHRDEGLAYITCGNEMPKLLVQVYEFLPGRALQHQLHYLPGQKEAIPVQTKIPSTPIALMRFDKGLFRICKSYINDIVDNHINRFAEICWKDEADEQFLKELFTLMTSVKLESRQEQVFRREVYRLIVVTYIMGRTLTIAEMTGLSSVIERAPKHATSRLATRQLKFAFFRIQKAITMTVFKELERILDWSESCNGWMMALIALVGICMANEDRQKTIHLVQRTRLDIENLDQSTCEVNAASACDLVDEVTSCLMCICSAYMGDIVQNSAQYQDNEAPLVFLRQVCQLVKANRK